MDTDYEEIFGRDLVDRMTRTHTVLHEAMPDPNLDYWIKGFMGEMRPEMEVRIWEAIAVIYVEISNKLNLSLEDKKELYNMLAMIASGFTMPNIEERLPAGSPNSSELKKRFDEAFMANERP